jgi:hypothetical protein
MAKDKFVYVVVEKWFYNNNGVDTAGTIGCADINVYSSLKVAQENVQSKMAIKTEQSGVEFEHYVNTYENNVFATITKVWCYSQTTYGTSNVRYAYVIQKQRVMTY